MTTIKRGFQTLCMQPVYFLQCNAKNLRELTVTYLTYQQ